MAKVNQKDTCENCVYSEEVEVANRMGGSIKALECRRYPPRDGRFTRTQPGWNCGEGKRKDK